MLDTDKYIKQNFKNLHELKRFYCNQYYETDKFSYKEGRRYILNKYDSLEDIYKDHEDDIYIYIQFFLKQIKKNI